MLPAHNARGQREAVGEERGGIGASVAVGVSEHFDAPRAAPVERIPRHLDDVDPPDLVDVHRHRIHHQRFGSHQLDLEAVFDFESREGVFRGIGRPVARCGC